MVPFFIPHDQWDDILLAVIAVSTFTFGGIGALVAAIKANATHKKIVHEMEPNSGGSLRDAVDRIEKVVRANSDEIDQVRKELASDRQEFRNFRNESAQDRRELHEEITDHLRKGC